VNLKALRQGKRPSGAIPGGRVDAYSVLPHEFGHVYAFNGFRDPFTGLLPADYASPYYANVVFDDENFFFVGSSATIIYAGLFH
jgi:hypothetical protein